MIAFCVVSHCRRKYYYCVCGGAQSVTLLSLSLAYFGRVRSVFGVVGGGGGGGGGGGV